MSGCHCGQAGSMFCESCSDLECRESMQYREDIEEQKALERQEEEEDWDEFRQELKNETDEAIRKIWNNF